LKYSVSRVLNERLIYMATDNRGVMVYLPSDVEEVLERYCTENNITRKNKGGEPMPSLGTGIVQYLKSQLFGMSPGNAPSAGLTREEVLELINQEVQRAIALAEQPVPGTPHAAAPTEAPKSKRGRRPSVKPPLTAPTLTFSEVNERYKLRLNSTLKTGEIQAEIAAAGYSDRLQYISQGRKFVELSHAE
jgi:hypothetical protein